MSSVLRLSRDQPMRLEPLGRRCRFSTIHVPSVRCKRNNAAFTTAFNPRSLIRIPGEGLGLDS